MEIKIEVPAEKMYDVLLVLEQLLKSDLVTSVDMKNEEKNKTT